MVDSFADQTECILHDRILIQIRRRNILLAHPKFSIMLLISCIEMTQLCASAQNPSSPTAASRTPNSQAPTAAQLNAAKQAWQKQHDASLKNVGLLKMPDLPDMQKYPHKTMFGGGISYPNAGPSYFFQFTAMEEAKPILDWYKSALSSSGWTVDRSNASTIMAKKDASTTNCVITVKKDIDGQGRTAVSIHYTTGHSIN